MSTFLTGLGLAVIILCLLLASILAALLVDAYRSNRSTD